LSLLWDPQRPNPKHFRRARAEQEVKLPKYKKRLNKKGRGLKK